MPIEVQFEDNYVSRIVLDESSVTSGLEPYSSKLLTVVDSNAEWYLETTGLDALAIVFAIFDRDFRALKREIG